MTSNPLFQLYYWLYHAPQSFLRPSNLNGQREQRTAVVACLLWFWAQFLYLHYWAEQPWPLLESAVEATAVVLIGGFPVLWWATPVSDRWRSLEAVARRWQWRFVFSLLLYVVVAYHLPHAELFRWRRVLSQLIVAEPWWLNLLFFLLGSLAALRVPFLLRDRTTSAAVRWGWVSLAAVYLLLSHSSLISPAFATYRTEGFILAPIYLVLCGWCAWQHRQSRASSPAAGLQGKDVLLAAVCIFTLYWFSTPYVRFGPFIAVQLFILAVVFGTRLGRQHFGYSFEPRWQDARLLAIMVAVALATLVPLGSLLGFLPFSQFNLAPHVSQVLVYVILFSMRVGIFEEVLFRSGLMVLVRDTLRQWGGDRLDPFSIAWGAILTCALLFGIVHMGNTPGNGVELPVVAYRLIYIALATLASLFYCLMFACTQRLWGGVVLHGLVDALAVVFFGASLVTPF
ncbi:CPBP family intramembrane metalloprotease [Thermosynechococcaceae cyanobacterium Okahandja]